jgi:hypothetical protein
MTRRFVIGIGGIDEAQGERIKGYLDSHGGWWHGIDNFWLFVTEEDDISVESLRDYLGALSKDVRTIVFEFDEEVAWAGTAPRREAKRLFRWLHDMWNSTSD